MGYWDALNQSLTGRSEMERQRKADAMRSFYEPQYYGLETATSSVPATMGGFSYGGRQPTGEAFDVDTFHGGLIDKIGPDAPDAFMRDRLGGGYADALGRSARFNQAYAPIEGIGAYGKGQLAKYGKGALGGLGRGALGHQQRWR